MASGCLAIDVEPFPLPLFREHNGHAGNAMEVCRRSVLALSAGVLKLLQVPVWYLLLLLDEPAVHVDVEVGLHVLDGRHDDLVLSHLLSCK
jgi:hypothetical protein